MTTLQTKSLEKRIDIIEGTVINLANEVKETNKNLQLFAGEIKENVKTLVDNIEDVRKTFIKEISSIATAATITKTKNPNRLNKKYNTGLVVVLTNLVLTLTMIVIIFVFSFSGQNNKPQINTKSLENRTEKLENSAIISDFQHDAKTRK